MGGEAGDESLLGVIFSVYATEDLVMFAQSARTFSTAIGCPLEVPSCAIFLDVEVKVPFR